MLFQNYIFKSFPLIMLRGIPLCNFIRVWLYFQEYSLKALNEMVLCIFFFFLMRSWDTSSQILAADVGSCDSKTEDFLTMRVTAGRTWNRVNKLLGQMSLLSANSLGSDRISQKFRSVPCTTQEESHLWISASGAS